MESRLIDIFVNWFPMLLLIAVWVFFLRRMGGGLGRGGFAKRQAEAIERTERQTRALERIADALEKSAAQGGR